MSNPYVPEGAPLSPWEDEPEYCPVCGRRIKDGEEHPQCWQ